MKHLFLSRNTIFCTFFVFLSACNQDDYSLKTDLCVVKESGDQSLYLLSDKGKALCPSSSLSAETYKEAQRYSVTYKTMEGTASQKDETVVNIFNMQPVLVKDAVLRAQFSNSISDPVWLVSQPWIGGGYLNFEFSYFFSDSNIKHGIYLVQETTVNGSTGENIHLTFGHDANGDASTNKATALASFPFNSVSGIKYADSLVINVLEGTTANPKQKTYMLVVPSEIRNSQ